MITSKWDDKALSRLMLGTVQFGLPYGVANRTGQPAYRDVVAIIAKAIEGGVNCFDTASAYGTSEDVLGQALRELGVADKATIVTKVRALTPVELADSKLALAAIEQSVSESRRRLQLECLPVILFHRERDAIYWEKLAELQKRGWVRHIGVSCDSRPGPASEFVSSGHFTSFQIPGNILDHRHQRSGIFHDAKTTGAAVFVRSVYLQGLLVMPEDEIPLALKDVIPAQRRLASLANQAGISLAELSLRYMLSQADITCVITGVETVSQVTENVAMFDRGALPVDLLSAIAAEKIELPEIIVTPNMWPPKQST